MTDEEFEAWLFDTARNPFRVLIIDLEHSAGVIRLGSQAWMSEFQEPYDDWLIRFPELHSSLTDFLSVGDVDAVNLDPDVDWLALDFRGQFCRWYYGDTSWSKSQFRPVATALIDNVRNLTERRFRFDLMDGGQTLRRTFASASSPQVRTVQSGIDYVMSEAGLPAVSYVGVSAAKLAYDVEFDVDTRSLVSSTIALIAQSVGAYVRVTQSGDVEVFIPDLGTTTPIVLTEDSIAYDGVQQTEIIPPYRRVTVEKADGSEVSLPTNTDTGQLNEIRYIRTFLSDTADATARATEAEAYYSTGHGVWRIPVLDKGHQIQVGDVVELDHYQVSGVGIVSEMTRSPLDDFTDIEVTI